MKRLAGTAAVITGAGSGMVRAMAERFVREGARVLCADISGAEREVAAALGRIDILVNNAGSGGGMIPRHDHTTANWDRIHAVSLKGWNTASCR